MAKPKAKRAPLPLQQPSPRASGVKRLVLELLYLYLVSTCCSALFSAVHHWTGLNRPVVLWGCAEVAFFLYHRWRVYQLHTNEEPHQFVVKDDNHFRDFLSLSTCIDFQDFITGWFFHKDFSDIKRGNVFDFIAYGFLYKRRSDLTAAEAQQVHRYVRATEDAWGLRFKDGYNMELDFMAHIFQPMQVMHKPLVWHLVMELIGFATHLVLWMWGFHHHFYRGVSFWVADKIAVCGLPLLMPPVSPLHASLPDTALTGTSLKPRKGCTPPSPHHDPHHDSELCAALEGDSSISQAPADDVATARNDGAGCSRAEACCSGSSSAVGAGSNTAAQLRRRRAAQQQQQQGGQGGCSCCTHSSSGGGKRDGSRRVGWLQDCQQQQRPQDACPGASSSRPQGISSHPCAHDQGPSTPPSTSAPSAALTSHRRSHSGLMDLCSGGLPSWPGVAAFGLDLLDLPSLTLPQMPSFPDLPSLPTLDLPSLPAWPQIPTLPQIPSFSDLPSLSLPQMPSFPDLPSLTLPQLPSFPDLPSLPTLDLPTLPSLTLRPLPTPRPPPPDALPIVFLHGVGLGIFPYLLFLRRLMAAHPSTPILLLEVRQVALRYTHTAEDFDSIAAATIETLRAHGYSQACFVAHSYGTFLTARICHMFPQHVHSVALIDPVCMLLCYPKTLHNFIYAPPALSHLLRHPGRALLDVVRWFCARDAGVAHTFCRRFFWHTLSLWPRQMPPKAVVALAGMDDLVPSDHIRAYLRRWGPGVKVLYEPHHLHGSFLLSPSYQQAIVDSITNMLRT